jgi:HlyD family secretion protein
MKRWFAPNKPAAWIVIAFFAGGIGAWWWHQRAGRQLLFRTAVVIRGDVAATINSSGTLEPVEVVDIGAQVAGRIISFGTDITGETIDYDSVVEKGAVLARIDDSIYAAALDVAKAQVAQVKAGELSAAASLEQAKAKFVQAEADWNRAQSLTASKLMAISDSDTAQANYAVAKADVSVADAALAEAKANTVQAQAALDGAQRKP